MKTTYYLIDITKVDFDKLDKTIYNISDVEWKKISEQQKFDMTEKQFISYFNTGLINTETDVLRIIKE